MPLNPDAQRYLDIAASRARPVQAMTPAAAREQQTERTAWANGSPESVARVYDREVPGRAGSITVRVYHPVVTEKLVPLVVFFHGGGWVACDLDTHDALCRAITNRAGSIVVSVAYPLAPEHKFPAGLDACWDVTCWLVEHGGEIGGDPALLAVCGDSAGATLAAAVALRARLHGSPRLALQVLLYPSTDYRLDSPTNPEYGSGYGLTVAALRAYYGQYLENMDLVTHPEVSPLHAPDLTGSAPAYITTNELDLLCAEGEDFAARLIAAGVPVQSRRYLGQIHGFIRATGVIQEAWEALDDIGGALQAAFARQRRLTAKR